MSNSKNAHDLIRQNEKNVNKPKKHDVNLQKNSTFYFQIGLIVCLLFTYGLFEMNFKTTIQNYGDLPLLVEPKYIDVPIIKPLEPTFEEPIEKKRTEQPKDFDVVPDDTPENPIVLKPETPIVEDNPPINPDDIIVVKEPEDIDVPIAFVEQAPIYPGCEKAKNNLERKKCMSEKIGELIQRKFQGSDLASNYGLYGMQRIRTQFKIDKTGKVTDIKVGGPHPKLEEEALRVINFIPTMTPGKQRDRNVGVIYTLPIVFQVEN